MAELSAYLDTFPNARIFVANLHGRLEFEKEIRAYLALRPQHEGRITSFPNSLPASAVPELLYGMFLNNAHDLLLPAAEGLVVPFGFQLYPGGGFAFDDPASDAKLARILTSPMFAFVIATQPAICDYLTSRFGVPSDRVYLIGSGPVWIGGGTYSRFDLKHGKATFDVGFIAHKYDDLRTKGYDFFIEIVKALAPRIERVCFHVIGNYEQQDIPLGSLQSRVTFHGSLDAEELCRVCHVLDVVVSPNVPSPTHPGTFDGFPTSSCSQAALAGAVIYATDPMHLNSKLVPGIDFLLLERDPNYITVEDVQQAAATLQSLVADPERLASLSRQGKRAFQALVGTDAQISPRVDLLRRALRGCIAPLPAEATAWRDVAVDASLRYLSHQGEIARLHGVIEQARAYIEALEAARDLAEQIPD